MKIRSLVLPLALAAGLAACRREPDMETRTFRLSHIQADEAAQIVDPYVTSLEQGRITVVKGRNQAITVRQTPRTLDRIAEVLREYDRGTPIVQLRFRVIEADGFATDSALAGPVLDALNRAFRFHGYRQLAEGLTVVSEFGRIEQVLSGGGHTFMLQGTVEEVVADSAGGSVGLSVAVRREDVDLISTQVTIPVGKTVVLGTAKPGSDSGAYILTVEPTVRSD